MNDLNLPQRKGNRLNNFDYCNNGAYFITICTKDRKQILCNIVGDDAHIVPKEYGKIAEKYIHSISGIDKYVIMPDHIHLIIKIDSGTMWASPPTKSISQIIKSFKTLVTKEIGEPIFQRSFYDHIIRNEQDYIDICQYIGNNPIKWQEKEQTL